MTATDWDVEVSDQAAADIQGIVRWTRRRFGPDQAVEYGGVIKAALSELRAEPDILGTRECGEAGQAAARRMSLATAGAVAISSSFASDRPNGK